MLEDTGEPNGAVQPITEKNMWERTITPATVLARFATFFSVLIIASQAVRGVNNYHTSLADERTERSITEVRRLTSDHFDEVLWVSESLYEARGNPVKYEDFHADSASNVRLSYVMNSLEALGYEYNTGKLDRDAIYRLVGVPFRHFFEPAKPYIEWMRVAQESDEVYKEFWEMCEDLKEREPEALDHP